MQLLKQGLHLEIFDPSRRMIEPGKAGSKLVPVVGGDINVLNLMLHWSHTLSFLLFFAFFS